MPLTNTINKLKALQRFDKNKAIADIINENGALITQLLKNQLKTGKDADDKVFQLGRPTNNMKYYDYYSDRTVFEKDKKGQPTAPITYYDTGNFYISLYVYASGSSFIFDSDVPYFADIIFHALAGERIIELNKENIAILRNDIILPQLRIKMANVR